MTFKIALWSFAMLIASGSSGPMLWAQCSNATGKGIFGFVGGGLDGSGNPSASVGQNNLNGAGKSTGTLTQSKDGVISTVSFTGTYSINPNCTGTGSLSSMGHTSQFTFVIDSSATHVETVGTDAGSVSSGQAWAQGTATCTKAGVKGTYGFHGGGTLVGTGGLGFAGQYILDGTGKLTGSETISAAGTITSQSISGTYSMASTCRGTISYKLNGKPSNWRTVVVNGGKGALAIESDAGSIATSEITLQ